MITNSHSKWSCIQSFHFNQLKLVRINTQLAHNELDLNWIEHENNGLVLGDPTKFWMNRGKQSFSNRFLRRCCIWNTCAMSTLEKWRLCTWKISCLTTNQQCIQMNPTRHNLSNLKSTSFSEIYSLMQLLRPIMILRVMQFEPDRDQCRVDGWEIAKWHSELD